MSLRLQRNAESLKALARANSAVRKSIIEHSSKDFVLTLVEIAKNILKGNVSLTREQHAQLRRYKRQIQQLVLVKTSLKRRKQIVQTGGLLGALIKPILSILLGST